MAEAEGRTHEGSEREKTITRVTMFDSSAKVLSMVPRTLTPPPSIASVNVATLSLAGVNMKSGKVYPHREGFRVYFRGDWYTSDEFGRPFKHQFYALSFLDLLNSLYDPDPRKNRYDPSRFKKKGPYEFEKACELYLEQKEIESGWISGKKSIARTHLIPFFGSQDFRTIDGVQLEALKKDLKEKGLSGKTIWNVFTVLHAMLNYKTFRSAFYSFPEFPDLKYQKPKIQWRTDQEIDQVFEFLQKEDLGYYWSIRGYGFRPEEASGLLKTAVNKQTNEVLVRTVYVNRRMKSRTKTNSERMIPMEICPEAMKYLIDDKLNRSSDSVFVFTSNGRPYSSDMWRERWNKAMDQAVKKYGTRTMTTRDLRHSAATRWRLKRVPLDLIRKLLGHSTQKTTDTFYADVDLHQVANMLRS